MSGNFPAGVPGNIRKCIPRFSCAPFLPMSCRVARERGKATERREKENRSHIYIFQISGARAALTSDDCEDENDDKRCLMHQDNDAKANCAPTLLNCCFSCRICVYEYTLYILLDCILRGKSISLIVCNSYTHTHKTDKERRRKGEREKKKHV